MSEVILPSFTVEHRQILNYGLDIIGVKNMWDKSIKGKNVNVAVIDTGCDVFHQELKENIIGVFNFTTDDKGDPSNVTDYLGHGTHVAGIIGSQNINHLIGVAPESNLLILKVINKRGSGDTLNLIKALKYAIEWRGPDNSKIDVINLSLGTTRDNPELRKSINEGIKNNVIIVAAAGNEGDGQYDTNEISYPGYYKDVFQIGATDQNNTPTSFSNSNKNIDFLAPGKEIYSSFPNNQFMSLSGTSMATPQVTGIVALIKNLYRNKGLEISKITVTDYLKQRSLFLPNYPLSIQGLGLIQI